MCKINQTLDKVKELGFSHYAITDHGNMCGVIDFYQAAKKRGITPIIGSEFYISSGPRGEKTRESKTYHLVLLAKTYQGYLNLMKLSSIGYLEGYYYKPRIDKEVLEQYKEGIICLSGCLKGEIAQSILNKDYDTFNKAIEFYNNLFGDDFYLEIQNHGIEEEDIVREALIKYHKKTNMNIVATNDVHYLNKGDHRSHDVLICIQTGKKLSDTDRMKYTTDQLYLKSAEEMYEAFKDIPIACENTVKIANKCNVEIPLGQNLLPKFPVPAGEKVEDVLIKEVRAGVVKRGLDIKEIKDRLNYEYKTIVKLGFSSYFLIVQDFVRFAKESGIPTGAGRGSVSGCLIAYLLGITEVNPLTYNLPFERFLNPDRVSMPDIDMDFADRDRQKVIDYVMEKYGSVSQIVTFGTMGPRAVIRDVGRVLGFHVSHMDALAKLVDQKNSLEEELEKNVAFKNLIKSYGYFLSHCLKLEDLNRHASIHAAGIIISPDDIINHCPLMIGKDGEIASQYDMKATEALGLLKMDFLGLRTLSVIDDVCKEKNIDINKIPLDDPKTFELFSKGNTLGVFQFESSGMRDLLRKLKAQNIEDIALATALYRPGIIDAGLLETYLKRRAGREKVTYLHPKLENSLKKTCGIYVYQESVMQSLVDVAGFTLAQADTMRKAIGKKDKDLLLAQKDLFINGCLKNGVNKETAEKIFTNIEAFARYSFNKSHSVGYGILAYQTAYLKANYPLEFFSALLTSEIGDISRVSEILYECQKEGIDVLPPDINKSDRTFTKEGNSIRFGLNSIRNIGGGDEIVKNRPYSSIYDFCSKVSINSRGLMSLINAGCFDYFGPRLGHSLIIGKALKFGKATSRFHLQFFPGPEVGKEEYTPDELADKEFEALGIYLTYNPLSKYDSLDSLVYVPSNKLEETDDYIITVGMVTEVKEKTDKNKRKMATCKVIDHYGQYDLLVFSSIYEAMPIEVKDVLIVSGRFNQGKVVAKSIQKLTL